MTSQISGPCFDFEPALIFEPDQYKSFVGESR